MVDESWSLVAIQMRKAFGTKDHEWSMISTFFILKFSTGNPG